MNKYIDRVEYYLNTERNQTLYRNKNYYLPCLFSNDLELIFRKFKNEKESNLS